MPTSFWKEPGKLKRTLVPSPVWLDLTSLNPDLDLPKPGIKPASPALQVDFLPLSHQESP